MDEEDETPYFKTCKDLETSRRRKGKKRTGKGNQKKTSVKKEDDNNHNAETSDFSDEDKSTQYSSMNEDDKLTIDASISNSPKIQWTNEAEEMAPSGSNTYPVEPTYGSSQTPTSPKFGSNEKTSPVTSPIESGSQNILYNTRALSKYAATYELEKFKKNALIIFNQINIDGYTKPRYGTEKDVEALTATFEKFGFEVTERPDRTKEELFKELKEFTNKDYTDYGCIGVIILTHGSNHGLLRAKDAKYSEIEIINHFKVHNKPTLVTKPKLLLIQACRGTKTPTGVPVFRAGKIQKDIEEEVEPYVLPAEADMLILHSSYVGNPSIRHETHGSWFIQSLCSKIDQLSSTQDLESIITEVKREVAVDRSHQEYNKQTYEMETNKQMPVLTSTLIRKLYLKKFGEESVPTPTSLTIPDSSKNEVLDSGLSTPLPVEYGPCSCFLDHFDYIMTCLKHYVDLNQEDETAQSFIDVADTFKVEAKRSKEQMGKAICKHLMKNAKDYEFYKFLYFYKY